MNLTDRLITEIVGKCDGLSITAEQASNILAYLQCGAPLDTTTNTGAASDERTKFNAWLEKRGVWPRLTYFEIWQAALATTAPQADAAPSADDAWESYLDEQKRIVGMPGLRARPSFVAGYKAGLAAPLDKESSKPAAKNCQTGWADICHMAKHDGVVCPDDSCDIDDGTRAAPSVEQDERGAISGFLSDVMTAAGLLSSGKQSKALASRLAEGCMNLRAGSTSANVAQCATCGMAVDPKCGCSLGRATSANVAQGAEAVEGWESIRVKNFLPFVEAVERAIDKGYLPDAMMAEWVAFEFSAAPPAQTEITDDARGKSAGYFLNCAAKGQKPNYLPIDDEYKDGPDVVELFFDAAQSASGSDHAN